MESKIPEWFLSFYESLSLAQLRAVRQLKSPKAKGQKVRTIGAQNATSLVRINDE